MFCRMSHSKEYQIYCNAKKCWFGIMSQIYIEQSMHSDARGFGEYLNKFSDLSV